MYEHIKTRYNAFSKTENDVFSDKDFARRTDQKRSYVTRLFENVEKGVFSSLRPDRTEMMGLIGAGNNPMVGMTVAVAVAIEEACK